MSGTASGRGAKPASAAKKRAREGHREEGTEGGGESDDGGGTRRSDRSSKKAKASLNEDELGNLANGTGTGRELKRQAADRVFWAQFDTSLLYTWLLDYDNERFRTEQFRPSEANRERLIDTLVQHPDLYSRPKESVALDELQKNWRHHQTGDPGVAAPGKRAIEMGMGGAEGQQKEIKKRKPKALTKAPLPLQQPEFSGAEEEEEMEEEEVKEVNGGGTAQSCMTCGTTRPPGAAAASSTTWICQGTSTIFAGEKCGFRGELPGSHPANQLILDVRMRREAAAAARLLSSQGSSSSQSHSDHPTPNPRTTTLEQEFERLAAAAPSFPLFNLPVGISSADRDAQVESAFAAGKSAHDSLKYRQPSSALIRLIQSGKLIHVGWALPIPIDKKEEEDTLIFSSSGGLTAKNRSVLEPTRLQSFAQFAAALFCTILPALIAQPAATAQWLSLARTIGQMNEEPHLGWEAARHYLERLLHSRIPERLPFAELHQTLFLSIAREARPVGGMQRQQHQQQQHGRGAPVWRWCVAH